MKYLRLIYLDEGMPDEVPDDGWVVYDMEIRKSG